MFGVVIRPATLGLWQTLCFQTLLLPIESCLTRNHIWTKLDEDHCSSWMRRSWNCMCSHSSRLGVHVISFLCTSDLPSRTSLQNLLHPSLLRRYRLTERRN